MLVVTKWLYAICLAYTSHHCRIHFSFTVSWVFRVWCRLFRWRLSLLKVIVSKRGELADFKGLRPLVFSLLVKPRTIKFNKTRVAPYISFGLLLLNANFFALFWLILLVQDQLICLIFFLVLLLLFFYFLYLLGFVFECVVDSFMVTENRSRGARSRKLASIPTTVCWVLKDIIKLIYKRVLISVWLSLLDAVKFLMWRSPSR